MTANESPPGLVTYYVERDPFLMLYDTGCGMTLVDWEILSTKVESKFDSMSASQIMGSSMLLLMTTTSYTPLGRRTSTALVSLSTQDHPEGHLLLSLTMFSESRFMGGYDALADYHFALDARIISSWLLNRKAWPWSNKGNKDYSLWLCQMMPSCLLGRLWILPLSKARKVVYEAAATV
ncbi:uncharacterized protein N7483_004581 [Penicillium malachiteum]|uniref:uncharacterized protein n=1 Tax=Penicillium malachiteum TaxID=1324776 RepID=UPI0025497C31|nr:uncharacterized protein N7483_004581 [Penicillium malachiteum]KAJ5730073.1 hypothetical protein N7483_004581 [Penicillium malachiteum]